MRLPRFTTARLLQAAAAAALVLAFVLVVISRGGDGLPEPPREGTVVFEGEDGWYLALPEGPADPFEGSLVWVLPGSPVERGGRMQPPPFFATYTPIENTAGLAYTATASGFVPLPDGDWYLAQVSTPPLSIGEYEIELTGVKDERTLVSARLSVEHEEAIEGVQVQRWDAERIAFGESFQAGSGASKCIADEYDEARQSWIVTCRRENVTTVWAVDAHSGRAERADGATEDGF